MNIHYTTDTCPYCDAKLDLVPKSNKKCPHCGEKIYIRTNRGTL